MKGLVLLLLFFKVVGAIRGDQDSDVHCIYRKSLAQRPHSVTITEFGAVGDGVTINTVAFQNAVFYLRSFADKGGAQLYVPKGKWLTGSFSLISHLTLFLDKGAVIIGTQDTLQYPVVDPLPSYGRGIELPGRRYQSLINGKNLTDVVVTGMNQPEADSLVFIFQFQLVYEPFTLHYLAYAVLYSFQIGDNGTIDGQGSVWWDSFHSHTLNYSRPHLVEFLHSDDILISNLTFFDPPAWTIHPVYCSNLEVKNITINAPSDSPYTNGIVPDSCSGVCIVDSSISVGHDAISLKSGWDEFGISFSKPSTNIYITKVSLQSAFGSALSFGSEMSGGLSRIHADHLNIHNSQIGVSFKTTQGRGGFIQDIAISDVKMEYTETAIQFNGQYGSHPDENYDPDAFPVINRVTIKNVIGTNMDSAGALSGIEHDPFTAICLSNINLTITSVVTKTSWTCSNVSGFSEEVFPEPCPDLQVPYSNPSLVCYSLANYKHTLLASA